MEKIAKGVNKINFTILYGNYCYIFIENFPQKFSPCTITGCVKDSIPSSSLRWNIVYRIPCKDFPSTYIGQIDRYLKTRIQEHKNSIKHLNSNRTALTNHVISTKHSFDFERATILSFEPFNKKRIIDEMILIKADKNLINHRTDVANLSLIYNSFIQ